MKANDPWLNRLIAAARVLRDARQASRASDLFARRVVNRWLTTRATETVDDWAWVSHRALACATVVMLLGLLLNWQVFRPTTSPELVVSSHVIHSVFPR